MLATTHHLVMFFVVVLHQRQLVNERAMDANITISFAILGRAPPVTLSLISPKIYLRDITHSTWYSTRTHSLWAVIVVTLGYGSRFDHTNLCTHPEALPTSDRDVGDTT